MQLGVVVPVRITVRMSSRRRIRSSSVWKKALHRGFQMV